MSRNRVSIILALMQLRRREEIVLPVFSPEWQQEALSVLWGKDRWISQEIGLEQCLSEMSVIAAEGTSKRESDTSKRTGISVLGCQEVAGHPVRYQIGRLGDLEWPGQLKCEHVRSLPAQSLLLGLNHFLDYMCYIPCFILEYSFAFSRGSKYIRGNKSSKYFSVFCPLECHICRHAPIDCLPVR